MPARELGVWPTPNGSGDRGGCGSFPTDAQCAHTLRGLRAPGRRRIPTASLGDGVKSGPVDLNAYRVWFLHALLHVIRVFDTSMSDHGAVREERRMPHTVKGRLIRHIPVRLIDVSWSGFLVTTNEPLAPGATGSLRVRVRGRRCADTAQIVRRLPQHGRHDAFTLGGQFAWGRPSGDASVRGEIPAVVAIP